MLFHPMKAPLKLFSILFKIHSAWSEHGYREGGLLTGSKNLKTPFFKRYWKFLSNGCSNESELDQDFKMMHYASLQLKGLQKCQRSKSELFQSMKICLFVCPILSSSCRDLISNLSTDFESLRHGSASKIVCSQVEAETKTN